MLNRHLVQSICYGLLSKTQKKVDALTSIHSNFSRFSLLASRFSLLASRFSLLASRFSLYCQIVPKLPNKPLLAPWLCNALRMIGVKVEIRDGSIPNAEKALLTDSLFAIMVLKPLDCSESNPGIRLAISLVSLLLNEL